MTYRGRLIFPFTADIARLDRTALAAPGAVDRDFRTPYVSYAGGALGARSTGRIELPVIQLSCQVEMQRWEQQRQAAAGDAPDSEINLVFHFAELETMGLVDDATGEPLVRVNDRLVVVRRKSDGGIVVNGNKPAQLFATEAQLGGIGLGGHRNLLIVTFSDRPQGLTTP